MGNDHLSRTVSRQVGLAGFRIGPGDADLQDHVGLGEEFVATRDDRGALFGVHRIGETSGLARTALDHDLQAGFGQARKDKGDEGDAIFSGEGFFGDCDDHNSFN